LNNILEKINSPSDLKGLKLPQLITLAQELREKIINTVSQNGGHLAPSLGVVELTIALHYVFDTPKDKIVWDVGHQAYAHKLLTGRRERFSTLRQYGGISGFTKRSESEYDAFGAGHASTSLSASLGIVTGRDLLGEKFKVIAVIGDGSLTGGIALEGLNQTGHLKKDIIVILNDNGMAISESVGALSQYLNKLITTPLYNRFKDDVWNLLGKLPSNLSGRARFLAKRIQEGLKSFIVPGIIFEELGFRYVGPLDGHDLGQLISTLKAVKNLRGPVLVHIITVKGKGYPLAEQDASKFHGVAAFDPETGESQTLASIPSYTEIFGKTLLEFGRKNEKIVAITAAMPEGTGLNFFAQEFPHRFFDVGIAEQHAVTFAAGLATQGYKPVVAIYSTFLQRAFDQLVHDVALQNLPVVFAIDRAGLVGEDGPTHHGVLDLSYLRQIPNLLVMAPKDENELRRMLKTALYYGKGPIAFRYPRGSGVGVPLDPEIKGIEIGEGEVIRKGRNLALLAIGSMVYPALTASEILEKEGIQPYIINSRFLKPLDYKLFKEIFKEVSKVFTVEENVLAGGFGSGVMEFVEEENLGVEVHRIGIPDRFIEQGGRNLLLELCGLTGKSIAEKVRRFIKGK